MAPESDTPEEVDGASQSQEDPGRNRRPRNNIYLGLRNVIRGAVASRVSVNTLIDTDMVMNLSLERLCTFIDNHQSLQRASIVQSRTFVEKKRFAPHRFIILELHRYGRKNVWIRLERKPTSPGALVSGKGRTPSNDVVRTT